MIPGLLGISKRALREEFHLMKYIEISDAGLDTITRFIWTAEINNAGNSGRDR